MNNNLTLEQSLDILNFMLRYKEDYDWDSEGIIYILVNYVKSKYMIKELLGNNIKFKDYVKDYLEDGTIDISMLWVQVTKRFEVDIWYSAKLNKFYVAKWSDKLKHLYKRIKKRLKNWIRYKRESYKMFKFHREREREIKKRINILSKCFSKANE